MRALRAAVRSIFRGPPAPPTIQFDEDRFQVSEVSFETPAIRWEELVRVWVVIAGSEAWWRLEAEGAETIVPTYLIANGDEFAERVQSLPGFRQEMFDEAKRVETLPEADGREFLCWSASAV